MAVIADGDQTKLVVGLGLAILLMAFAATLIMKLLASYPWISWLGLIALLYVAFEMLYRGVLLPADAPNRLDGKVLELIYFGDHIRCRMAVAGHDAFIVNAPNSLDHPALNVGESYPVGWMTEDCRAFDAA